MRKLGRIQKWKFKTLKNPVKASYFKHKNLDDPIIYSNLSDKEERPHEDKISTILSF